MKSDFFKSLVVIFCLAFLVSCNAANTNQKYTVVYNGNGNASGTVPVDSTHYEQNQIVTVLANTYNLTKTDYTFAGWSTQADGLGTSYVQGQTFVRGSANVTLYAKWTSNPAYTVTYDGNGNASGSVPVDSTHYEQGQIVTVLGNTNNLTHTGYTFAGWSTQADGLGTSYVQGQTFVMGSANVTLYAKWTGGVSAVGIIKKQGITFYMYGTHVLVNDNGQTLYALKSNTINLDNYIDQRVTVSGDLVSGYPVDFGPDYLDVKLVE